MLEPGRGVLVHHLGRGGEVIDDARALVEGLDAEAPTGGRQEIGHGEDGREEREGAADVLEVRAIHRGHHLREARADLTAGAGRAHDEGEAAEVDLGGGGGRQRVGASASELGAGREEVSFDQAREVAGLVVDGDAEVGAVGDDDARTARALEDHGEAGGSQGLGSAEPVRRLAGLRLLADVEGTGRGEVRDVEGRVAPHHHHLDRLFGALHLVGRHCGAAGHHVVGRFRLGRHLASLLVLWVDPTRGPPEESTPRLTVAASVLPSRSVHLY